jgi:hypothetical protein
MHNASGPESQNNKRDRWADYGLRDDDDDTNWKTA